MDTNTQTRTLVATFDDYDSARKAVRELENQGVPQDAIQIRSNLKTAGAGSESTTYAGEHEESGFSGWLNRLFGGDSDEAANHGHYDEALRRGNAVVTVQADDDSYDRTVETLNQFGAVDIDRRAAAWRETGYSGYDPNQAPYTADQALEERQRFSNLSTNTDQAGPLSVIEEELQVGKRVVQRGGVRVYSRVVDRPVEESIQLREEHVRVERRPVDRPASASELNALRDQTIEVTETAEEPVVSKRARVTEEVYVGKEATERTETIRDNVRHTEVEVDSLDNTNAVPGSTSQTPGANYTGSAGTSYAGATGAGYSDYGTRYANDPRFRGKSWDNVEQDLRSDYMRSNPNSSWDTVKGDIRSGWDKALNKL